MKRMIEKLQAKALEVRGATAVEYALLVGLIAVVIIVAVLALGGTLNSIFEGVNSELSSVAPSA